MPDLKPNDYLNDAKQFAHSAILNWGTDQPESNAAIAAASANALISIADSLARIAAALEAPKAHGRCGANVADNLRKDEGSRVGDFLYSSSCELPAGHDGWHRDGRTEWSPLTEGADHA